MQFPCETLSGVSCREAYTLTLSCSVSLSSTQSQKQDLVWQIHVYQHTPYLISYCIPDYSLGGQWPMFNRFWCSQQIKDICATTSCFWHQKLFAVQLTTWDSRMDLELRDDFKTNLKQLNLRTDKKLNCQQTIANGVRNCIPLLLYTWTVNLHASQLDFHPGKHFSLWEILCPY